MSDISKTTTTKTESSARSAKKRNPSLTNVAKPKKETSLYQELQTPREKPVIVSGDGSLRVRKPKRNPSMSKELGKTRDVSSRSKRKTRQKDDRRLLKLAIRIKQKMKALELSNRSVRKGDDTYEGTMDETELNPNINPVNLDSPDTIRETVQPKALESYQLVSGNEDNGGNLFIKEGTRTIPFWMKKRSKSEKLPVRHLNTNDIKEEVLNKRKLEPYPNFKLIFDEGEELPNLKKKDIFFTPQVLIGTTGRPLVDYFDPDISERSRRVPKKKKPEYQPPVVTIQDPKSSGGIFTSNMAKLKKKLSSKDKQ